MLIELYVIKNTKGDYWGGRNKQWVREIKRARIFPKGQSLSSTIGCLSNVRKVKVGSVEVIDSEVENAIQVIS